MIPCESCHKEIYDSQYSTIHFCEECQHKEELIINFEGVDLIVSNRLLSIEPGDLYLAKRNTGWKLLTCDINIKDKGYIRAKQLSDGTTPYPYDIHECFKIISMKE